MDIRLMQRDCLEAMKEIEDESVDLIVTDPPYKIITGGDKNGKNSVRPQGILRGNRKLFKNNQDCKSRRATQNQ